MDQTSPQRTPLVTAVAAATVIGLGAVSLVAGVAGRRRKQRWAANPDPLGGRVPRFPAGADQVVETDDGAELHTVWARPAAPTVGTPPIVLVHGLTASVDDWGPVAERLLDRGFDVIGVDLRGHGRSTQGRDPYRVHRLGRDLAAVLNGLGITGAVLVGHSMGGMAVQSLVVEYPERGERPEQVEQQVAGLVLVSTAARLATLRHRITTPLAAQVPLPVPTVLADSPLVLAPVALSAFGPDPSLFMLRQAVASFARCPSETRQLATAGLNGFDLFDRLPTVTLPTLVVSGTRDQIVPLAESEQIARAIPGASLAPIADAGHLVIWERPARLADLIADHATAAANPPSARH